MRPIIEIANELGLSDADLVPCGEQIAKLRLAALPGADVRPSGRIILVSSINPTPAGEGKTTVAIGLGQGIRRLGERVVLALREPSLGPLFGIKGGGTGGGQCRLEPSNRINMHFTGDIHAIGAAHNLLTALIDNAIHHRNGPDLDQRQVVWHHVLDMNDRALRQIVVGLGGRGNSVPRESGFDITAASEVMALLSLADGVDDLKRRLGDILIGFEHSGHAVTASQLHADGPMAALLHDAILPNLVQSGEGVPALVHGGPFANIAHGCNSVLATRSGAVYADYVVTEAGFGFELGAEKFFHLKCRSAGLWPSAVVLVVTARALRIHDLAEEGNTVNMRGLQHLEQHVQNVNKFGFQPVIAINLFDDDHEADLQMIERWCIERELPVARFSGYADGGTGGEALAEVVLAAANLPPPPTRFLYDLEQSPEQKIAAVASTLYGATDITYSRRAQRDLVRIRELGFNHLPVCIAKTHLSFSDNPAHTDLRDFVLNVAGLHIKAGAGYLLVLTGDILTMPGLPRQPAASRIDLNVDGSVSGL